MKKGFFSWAVGAILVALLSSAIDARPDRSENKNEKQKVQIIVADKKERNGTGGENKSQRPRSDSQKSRGN